MVVVGMGQRKHAPHPLELCFSVQPSACRTDGAGAVSALSVADVVLEEIMERCSPIIELFYFLDEVSKLL